LIYVNSTVLAASSFRLKYIKSNLLWILFPVLRNGKLLLWFQKAFKLLSIRSALIPPNNGISSVESVNAYLFYMLVVDLKVMRGPNFWSVEQENLIAVKLDLEDYEGRKTSEVPGFTDKILGLFPGFTDYKREEHSLPFSEELKQGVSFPYVIGYAALELQKLGGMPTGFMTIGNTNKEGVYNIVFSYKEEEAGLYAARAAIRIVLALLNNTGYDIGKDIDELAYIRRYEYLGLSTGSVVDEALRRGIPYTKSHDNALIILGYGSRQQRIQATIANTTSYIGVDLAGDKDRTKKILKEALIPIPDGVTIESQEELVEAIKEVGYPLVTKPLDGNHGRGITLDIKTFEQAIEGFKIAKEISDTVIIEKYVTGVDYRLLVINYKFVAAVKREPASVVGNGTSTIKELIDSVNADPRREKREGNILQKLDIDEVTLNILKKNHLTPDSVLPAGQVLHVKETGNVSSGAIPQDVTDEIHPHNVYMAERIARLIDLDICGIDVMSPDMKVPLKENGGAIIEVNAAPGIRMHIAPAEGKSRNAAGAIVDMLFPPGTPALIPLVAVTGTNGKTTTTRLIAHIAHLTGLNVGYVTTEGIYVNDMQLKYGDCSGPQSAKVILKDKTVDFAVLECARGGILRSGLGFSRCDIGILINVGEDHLGLNDINTVEDMARVKSVVPRSVKKEGYAILNADDDHVFSIAGQLQCNVAFFGISADNPRIAEQRKKGRICAYTSGDSFILFDGKEEITISGITEVPLTYDGKAEFMIQNVLPAIISSHVQGFGTEIIRKGLLTFESSAEVNPGRLNFFQFRNFRIMLDYAHNPAGLEAISKFLEREEAEWNIGIITAPGDRRDEDIIKIGRIAARVFDHIIIRNDIDLRGRTAENIHNLLLEGIRENSKNIRTDIIPLEADAIKHAIEQVKPNSLISVFSESPSEAIKTINRFLLEEEKENQQQSVSKL
jgi:cyanophycin synthetase